jgi:hypothetical protein
MLLTQFDPDPARLAVIGECTKSYDVGDPDAEWPNNILSRHSVVYGSGAIARRGAKIAFAVEEEELDLCRRLADEAALLMQGTDVGMGSESSDPFRAFFVASNAGDPNAPALGEEVVRSRFGGTIFPPATITVEPLREAGVWWAEVLADGEGSGDEYLRPWRAMIEWFRRRAEFIDSAFVRIGDRRALWDIQLDRGALPEGTELTGCVLPRLALGLTARASLVGLFGYSVQT